LNHIEELLHHAMACGNEAQMIFSSQVTIVPSSKLFGPLRLSLDVEPPIDKVRA
jgi:hypothetical protein